MTAPMSRRVVVAPLALPQPRMQVRASARDREVLDGGWWPRSRDLLAELPGLITALTARYGRVRKIMLNDAVWANRCRRLAVGSDVVRIGWFATLESSLVIIFTDRNERLDLMVVPPATPSAVAQHAMAVAASSGNMTRAADILKPRLSRAEIDDATFADSFRATQDPLAGDNRPIGLNGHTFADVAASVRLR
jgi:hypothetical protein